ncbi:group III truncated hemoglobin [Cribrihabitans sp. XS_ASV171]
MAQIEARTGLDDTVLRELVHAFYGKIPMDPVLGPIFAERITDWTPHLERMTTFWSSVALMTGRCHGAPVVCCRKNTCDLGLTVLRSPRLPPFSVGDP